MLSAVARTRPHTLAPVLCRFISVGQSLPEVTNLRQVLRGQIETTSVDKLFGLKRVIMFGVPGAFSPACSELMLPGYVEKALELKQHDIDEIVCVAPNDAFVVKSWAKQHKVYDQVTFVADGNGELTREMGLLTKIGKHGLAFSAARYAAVVEDKLVKYVVVEQDRGDVTSTAAARMLEMLKSAANAADAIPRAEGKRQ